jgi:hypothetical protein
MRKRLWQRLLLLASAPFSFAISRSLAHRECEPASKDWLQLHAFLRRICGNRALSEASSDMAGLRRVFGNQAGPTAIGILVPPGTRTAVVVRPRSLPWDLLLVEAEEAVIRFREFGRDEAEAVAEAIAQALDDWSDSDGRVESTPAPGSPGHCVRIAMGPYRLVACPRLPGQTYRPMVWATAKQAMEAADALRQALCPPAGARQEIYFNSRYFSR